MMMDNILHECNTEALSDTLFALFSELIYKTAGIKLNARKKVLLLSRLQKRLNALGLRRFEDYYKRVKSDDEERIIMLNCIATNTTTFFREKHHFDFLRNNIMPELLVKKAQNKTIRIWSAGCSTGEEPYSIVITLCEALTNSARCHEPWNGWDIKVLATDISTKVLENAELGIYELDQVPGHMAAGDMARYFLKGNGENAGKVKVRDYLGEIIRFRRLNLKEEVYPLSNVFDVIFCRNVMIYFDDEMKEHVLSKFHHHLVPGGYLFLGHSETIFGKNKFNPAFITVYRKQ
ncbi:MAG: protein-glutamate O-methyltransferase CheR [Nitrospirae bacterium]|nr:protein-glutamate O-methyltransferase CheR [Nitrospirota bacterium]